MADNRDRWEGTRYDVWSTWDKWSHLRLAGPKHTDTQSHTSLLCRDPVPHEKCSLFSQLVYSTGTFQLAGQMHTHTYRYTHIDCVCQVCVCASLFFCKESYIIIQTAEAVEQTHTHTRTHTKKLSKWVKAMEMYTQIHRVLESVCLLGFLLKTLPSCP